MFITQISIFLAALLSSNVQAYRILAVFPLHYKSHFNFNEAVMQSLASAGHNVTIITSRPEQLHPTTNYTVIDISDPPFIEESEKHVPHFLNNSGLFYTSTVSMKVEETYCRKVLHLKQIQEILNSTEKLYDVVFLEFFILYKCYMYVAQKLQVPVIGTVSTHFWLYTDSDIGNTFYPSYIPFEKSPYWSHRSFYARLQKFVELIQFNYIWLTIVQPTLRRFHQDSQKLIGTDSSYMDISASLVFYNSHHTYLPRPVVPNAIEVGGIHITEPKPLPQDIRQFIEDAEHGVILFSFGSQVECSVLGVQKLNAFIEAFREIPQRVIWRNTNPTENVSSNVLLRKWIPQRDILAHKNVIAVMSHCGQSGVFEAIDSATPIIAIPLFAEQDLNTGIVENLNISVSLDKDTITKESILSAIKAITQNGYYAENIRKLSKVFKNRPLSPQQSVVYWTEYVIENNGAPHLETATRRLSWFKFLFLDLIGLLILVVIILAYIWYRVVKVFYCELSYVDQNKKVL